MVGAPEVEVRLGEIRHDIHDFLEGKAADILHFLERLQHVIAEFAGPSAQFNYVERFVDVQRDLGPRQHAVTQEAHQHLAMIKCA